jgi:DNA ligase (NAD+)
MSPTIDKMLANGVEILPPQEDIHAEADQAERKTVCISGKLPSGKKKADYEAPLKAAGYELVDDVSKGLTYLVLADPDSTSSKAAKARKLGIEIINEDGIYFITR